MQENSKCAPSRKSPTASLGMSTSAQYCLQLKRESKVMQLTPMTHNQSHTQIQRVSCPEQGCHLVSVSASTQDGEI